MEYISLNNGVRMPQEGFGTFQIPPKDCKRCVKDAVSAGYRLIDTASAYGNEESVGAAIRESGIPREELFITTKLWVQDASYEGAKKAVDASLKKLGIDYLDLYLIHQPFGDYYSAWRAMEEMYRDGKVRAIGVCNFDDARLVDLCLNHEVRPAVDQIEIHPFHQQGKTIQIMKKYGIQPQAWGPLVEGQKDVFRNKQLSKIAVREKHCTGDSALACAEGCHDHSQNRTAGTYGRKQGYLGFCFKRRGYEGNRGDGFGTQ